MAAACSAKAAIFATDATIAKNATAAQNAPIVIAVHGPIPAPIATIVKTASTASTSTNAKAALIAPTVSDAWDSVEKTSTFSTNPTAEMTIFEWLKNSKSR